MSETPIELVYFEGCPCVGRARANLGEALRARGLAETWVEWELGDGPAPDRVRGYGSPTVLVGGRDVAGTTPAPPPYALTCSAGGAPTAEEIRAALGRQREEAPGG